MTNPLRPHQVGALETLRMSLTSGSRRPMVMLPTGGGKTRIAAAIVEGAMRKGKRVIFTVPALELIDQTVDAFWREGIRDVGVIQADHPLTNPARPVQVASVQTLQRRTLPLADVVVIDEAHRVFEFYGEWMRDPEWERVPFIGLSATPWTKGLAKLFDDLIVAATTQDLIEAGYLSRFRVFAPSHPDLSKVRTKAGDYHEGDLSEVMGEAVLVADVVETWKRMGEGRPTICFAVDRAHARHLLERFEAAGVAAAYVDAFTPTDERRTIRNQFHSGEVKVVCNVGVLTTGVDWDVRCIILARPTKSEMLFVQIVGRGLRTADGKDDCLILDHSDTHLRLGFVTDIHHDALDDGSPKKADGGGSEKAPPLPKECPKCSFLKPAKVRECPSCGFVPDKAGNVEQGEGELIELKGGKQKASPGEKRRWYAELLGYAAMKAKTDKWVLANFRAKFNEWPATRHVEPQPPQPDVIGWLTSRRIAWAKGKGRQERAA